jgi:hypothetical protein
MKQIVTSLIIMSLFLAFFSCKKTDKTFIEEKVTSEREVSSKFFSIEENVDPIAMKILNEIKFRDESKPFVNSFAKINGFPIWEKALISTNANKDTVVYIPLVLNKTRFTNGYIKAYIKNEITITSFKSSDYKNYPFSNNNTYNANNFASFIMYFDNKIFGHDRFILKDNRLFSGSLKGNQEGRREIKIVNIDKKRQASRITSCYTITENIEWLEKDSEHCTCVNKANCDWLTGCTDCSNSFSTSYSYTSGDCSGGGEGVTWNPYPPPGGGGSSTISSSSLGWVPYPNDPAYQDFVDYTLTQSQRTYWNNPNKAGFIAPLVNKLVLENFSYESQSYVQSWLNYLIGDNNIIPEEFQNYFMYTPEGQDGTYNFMYWDNPNLTFQTESLPNFQAFISAFPKVINQDNTISEMPASDVYTLVGGNMDVQNKSKNPYYQNGCTIRGSRGFNYCGKPIDNTVAGTELGDDGKRYILNAKAFNKYMNKKFGTPTHRLTKADINGNPANIKNFLRGKNGIYTMVTSGGSFSGHVDLIIKGLCLSTSATRTIENVSFIEIWELP